MKHQKKILSTDFRSFMRTVLSYKPLWELNIEELSGHNIEARGREEVNALLKQGWILLHIYTLKYQEDGIWRERPMAILGRPKSPQRKENNIQG